MAATLAPSPAADQTSQHAVVSFLSTPAAYGPLCERVDRIETHISIVFLASGRAYKLKRAVRLPYVDYSTLELRRDCCEREVSLNRRTAPDLYLGVVPVTRSPGGTLSIRGTGVPVEWLVEMVRFDQDALLDAVARRGALDPSLATAVGRAAADLHTRAAPRQDHGGAAGMRWVIEDNHTALCAGPVLDRLRCEQLHEALLDAWGRHRDLLDMRRASGWVRECHGDLHLGNICVIEGRPVLFDVIEFNEELSCVDVLYDLAFLVMDLLHRDLPVQANAVVNAWMAAFQQYAALPLLPLFLSCRAAIRAKVLLSASAVAPSPARAARLRAEAGAYFERAIQLGSTTPGAIIAVGGVSGSGKSTLARHLAPYLGSAPGAIVLRSDVVRKRLFGVEPTERLMPVAYEPSVSRSVYRILRREAREVARAGYVAIVDAVFGSEEWRNEIQHAAEREGVPFAGVWLDAPLDVLERRLVARRADVSDATVEVLRQQHATVSPPARWARVDASGDLPAVIAATALPSQLVRRGECCAAAAKKPA